MRRQQSILILDDVWNHFVLEKVGILVRVKGCKLILTTRLLDVCKDGLPSENQRGAPFSGRSLVLIFGESWAWTCTSSISKRYCKVSCKRMFRSATCHNSTGWKHEGNG